MKRTVISILIAVAALVGAIPAKAQVVQSEDGTITSYDNLILGKKEAPWKVEVSVRQVATLGWLPELATVGLRKGDVVYGLGAGHRMWKSEYSIPFYAYNRIYFPPGEKRRMLFYSDAFLGYDVVYRNPGYVENPDELHPSFGKKKGDGIFFFSWQPGFAVRMWGKSNLFLGLVVTPDLRFIGLPLFGLHLGLAI